MTVTRSFIFEPLTTTLLQPMIKANQPGYRAVLVQPLHLGCYLTVGLGRREVVASSGTACSAPARSAC